MLVTVSFWKIALVSTTQVVSSPRSPIGHGCWLRSKLLRAVARLVGSSVNSKGHGEREPDGFGNVLSNLMFHDGATLWPVMPTGLEAAPEGMHRTPERVSETHSRG